MSDSPAAASPYEVLGVSPSASDDELRRAYRRLLRHTHPDVGGDAAAFHTVQIAWERVGTPADRADYDRRRYPDSAAEPERPAYASGAGRGQATQAGPRARMYGHPGGEARQRYLELLREWAGRGTSIDDPYAPTLIRSAPREIRHWLAKALAEESTAQLVSALGIGFTAWHDVVAGATQGKVDHVVLGPAGLFAVLSEDWGGPVQLRRGELVGDALDPDDRPIEDVEGAVRALAKSLRVRFTAVLIVLPDEALDAPQTVTGRGRRPTVITLPRSRLIGVLRSGLPGIDRGSFEKVFELRSRLQDGIRFSSD